MITKEKLTIKKAELFAEVEKSAKKKAKTFVENTLNKIGESTEIIMQGHTIVNCPSYIDPKYVADELSAAGFKVEKTGYYNFSIEW